MNFTQPPRLTPEDRSAFHAAWQPVVDTRRAYLADSKMTPEGHFCPKQRDDPEHRKLYRASQDAHTTARTGLARLAATFPWADKLYGLHDEIAPEGINAILDRDWRDEFRDQLIKHLEPQTTPVREELATFQAFPHPGSANPGDILFRDSPQGLFVVTRHTHKGKRIMARPFEGGDEVRLMPGNVGTGYYGTPANLYHRVTQAWAETAHKLALEFRTQLENAKP